MRLIQAFNFDSSFEYEGKKHDAAFIVELWQGKPDGAAVSLILSDGKIIEEPMNISETMKALGLQYRDGFGDKYARVKINLSASRAQSD